MLEVLVVDDQALRNRALCLLVDNERDMTSVHAPSPAEAVRISGRTGPDVIVWHTEPSHWPLIRRALDAARGVRVLTLTDDASSFRALRAGASSTLPATVTADELLTAVRRTAAGGAVVPSPVVKAVIEAVRTAAVTAPEPHLRLASLTHRELEVIGALARGWSNDEIAAQLSLSRTTVKSHVSHIFHKIGARDRLQAVVFALNAPLSRQLRLPLRPEGADRPSTQSRPESPKVAGRAAGRLGAGRARTPVEAGQRTGQVPPYRLLSGHEAARRDPSEHLTTLRFSW
ncbi:response regulator transcription factor [Streptomyces atroolivaceus]|uniref:LuxR C-terminal-related transcriptional regulator n=1 Tax=Streptomyces atroolivaceus TaxID=66869 RepID=A0ABV9VJ33_STRAZ|nr:response regulator transcription factor [Streptomyces atroolivaceus]